MKGGRWLWREKDRIKDRERAASVGGDYAKTL
jgi:hypothetical protein